MVTPRYTNTGSLDARPEAQATNLSAPRHAASSQGETGWPGSRPGSPARPAPVTFPDTFTAGTRAGPGSMAAPRRMPLERKTAALGDALRQSLNGFLQLAAPRPDGRRSATLARLEAMLAPLADSPSLQRADLLTLLEASAWLQRLSRKACPAWLGSAVEKLVRDINSVTGSGAELKKGVLQLARRLEHKCAVPVFLDHFTQQYPHLLAPHPVSGQPRLTDEGARQFAGLRQQFDSANRHRHVIGPAVTAPRPAAQLVGRLLGEDGRHYQDALQSPEGAKDTAAALRLKQRLVECAQIAEALALATPEQPTCARQAPRFPGAVDNPRLLVAGQIYQETGFLVAGGGAGMEHGFRMNLGLAKGFPVEIRSGPGESGAHLVRWITLPGAQFRYEGAHQERGVTTHEFTQISR